MTDCAYSQDELQAFYSLLDCVVSEVAERELQLSVFVMINRLFAAAGSGTRNPEALRKAILKDDAEVGCTASSLASPTWIDRSAGRRLFVVSSQTEAA